ncbi:MAG: Tol-Pal system protein TolB, partial [Campylobacter sp.]|nr:Tol-Pal system protein TolB [Campylobacteraceae bacterium]MDY5887622.1 Tol-Pal system protein TolB [Campylobacter sp.]
MKKILVLLVFITSIFAADATIEVVNRGLVLPRILIQDATTNFDNSDVKERFSRMIAGDLRVGSAFEVIEGIEIATYDAPLGAEIAAKNPAFVLRYELAGGSGETTLKVKLI